MCTQTRNCRPAKLSISSVFSKGNWIDVYLLGNDLYTELSLKCLEKIYFAFNISFKVFQVSVFLIQLELIV